MTRRTMAERKQRAADRDTRRESLLVLLSRTRRAVPLTPSEAALLFAHVEVEIAESNELRRTVQGQQTALQRAYDRTAAAEAAIVEAEKRAEQAEHYVGILQAVDEGRAHGARRVMDERDQEKQRADIAEAELRTLRAGVRASGADPATIQNLWAQLSSRTRQWREEKRRAEQAERRGNGWRRHAIDADHKADRYRTAWLAARRDRRADRAAMADELPLVQAVSRVRDLAARMRAGSPQGAAAIYADRVEQALAIDRGDSTASRRILLTGIPECPATCTCRTAEESTP
ncbi:hypothetical protein [Streptomyces sp. NPDC058254]|uniref:hypothetical protein n=1 Tax=Streptomyces sp. NPDC058254 TaxID=3346406 RepID=UPI0036F08E7C